MGKICSKCGIEKDTSEFVKSSRKKDGFYPSCRECKKVYNIQHKKEISEYNANYKIEHKEEVAKRDKEYQKNTKSARNAYKLAWYNKNIQLHPEAKLRHNASYMIYYFKNKERLLKKASLRAKAFPQTKQNNLRMAFYVSIIIKPEILKRDKYACQLCGNTDVHALRVHHIFPKHLFPDLIEDKNNLIILCTCCHFEKAHNSNYQTYNEDLAQTLLEQVKSRN